MASNLSVRNERRNRRRALLLTSIVTGLVLGTILYAGSPAIQDLISQLMAGMLGESPQTAVQP